MKNVLRHGINSNVLKTIAIIAMVIDHIGFYFYPSLPTVVYTICRYTGRIAMPIFVYLLVQGFFHTKNFKKYIFRLGIFAVITQILVTILMLVNIKYVPDYTSAKQVYTTGNILFTFVISMVVLKLLHEDVLIKKWDYNKNLSLKIILIAVIFVASIFIPLDYGIEVLILSILMYYIEKFKIQLYIEKSRGYNSIKNIFLNNISDSRIKMLYLSLILFALTTLVVYFNSYWSVLLGVVPIALYNGERGEINMKYVYYITFPLQHAMLYLLALFALT
ncbi:MAG: hypothetical protein IJ272_05325 [Clostridia bacterium]|nr:hypothetical protein [Clostridia bacterium]